MSRNMSQASHRVNTIFGLRHWVHNSYCSDEFNCLFYGQSLIVSCMSLLLIRQGQDEGGDDVSSSLDAWYTPYRLPQQETLCLSSKV